MMMMMNTSGISGIVCIYGPSPCASGYLMFFSLSVSISEIHPCCCLDQNFIFFLK